MKALWGENRCLKQITLPLIALEYQWAKPTDCEKKWTSKSGPIISIYWFIYYESGLTVSVKPRPTSHSWHSCFSSGVWRCGYAPLHWLLLKNILLTLLLYCIYLVCAVSTTCVWQGGRLEDNLVFVLLSTHVISKNHTQEMGLVNKHLSPPGSLAGLTHWL